MIILWTVLIILAVIVVYQVLIRLIRRYAKFPAPAFISVFLDSRFRRSLQPPVRVVSDSGVKPGMKVLEIGSGSGLFTLDAARAAGENGRVYALDIQKDMLDKIRHRLALPENRDIHNIEMVNKSAYELPFEDNSLDLAFMVAVFQEIPDKQKTLSEIKRVLKPGGILAISEFWPDPDFPWVATTRRMGHAGGFVTDGVSGTRWNYTARFKKP